MITSFDNWPFVKQNHLLSREKVGAGGSLKNLRKNRERENDSERRKRRKSKTLHFGFIIRFFRYVSFDNDV